MGALADLQVETIELARDHRELAECLVAEKQTKVRAYADAADARTNTDRLHVADLAALDLTADVFRLKGSIAAHEVRVAYLSLLIQQGRE